MKLFAGIDGGGTKTRCVISYEDGRVIAEAVSGPSNPNYYGLEKTLNNILKGLKQCLINAKLPLFGTEFESICVGLSGAGPKNRILVAQELELRRVTKTLTFGWKKLSVYPDFLIAWHGAFDGHSGIVTIVGTGHFVYGRNGELAASSADLKFDDLLRGGGFHIGLYGTKIVLDKLLKKSNDDILLNLLIKSYDKGILWNSYRSGFSFKSLLEDAQRAFHHETMNILRREDVAAVAYYVSLAAEQGHLESTILIEKSAERVIAGIEFVKQKLQFGNTEKVRLAIIGSLIKSLVLSSKIKSTLAVSQPTIILVPPLHTPEIGALHIALHSIYYP